MLDSVLTACCPRCRSHSTTEVVSIAVIRVWIRCDGCGCTWREKPAAYLLRQLMGRSFGLFTRHSHSGHGTKPAAEVAAATTVERDLSPEDAQMLQLPASRPRGPTSSLTVEDLERWFDGCDQDSGPQAEVPGSPTEWLDSDPFVAPAEQPTRWDLDQAWVLPQRPSMHGTFVERLDSLYDGLVKLETFVLRCRREEEATAKRLEPPREAPRPGEPGDGNVLPWLPAKREKTTAA